MNTPEHAAPTAATTQPELSDDIEKQALREIANHAANQLEIEGDVESAEDIRGQIVEKLG